MRFALVRPSLSFALKPLTRGVSRNVLNSPFPPPAFPSFLPSEELSNCPSGRHGGSLGQLGRGDTVPEFEQALFNGTYTGVYPQLLRTRFGFHILCVDRREPGRTLPFDVVQGRIHERLCERMRAAALARYVRQLAGPAAVSGIEVDFEGSLIAESRPS